MTILYYDIPGRGRIGASLSFGLDLAVAMLATIIDGSDLDPSGAWYCEKARH